VWCKGKDKHFSKAAFSLGAKRWGIGIFEDKEKRVGS
jgi:hypothetical protein